MPFGSGQRVHPHFQELLLAIWAGFGKGGVLHFPFENLMKQRLQSGFGTLKRHARLESAKHLNEAAAPVVQLRIRLVRRQRVLHGDGDADLRPVARLDAVEALLADADDGDWTAVHDDLLPDDAAVAGEARSPITVADDGQRMAALKKVVRSVEHATCGSSHAEHWKIITGDQFRGRQFGTPSESDTHHVAVPAEHPAEDLILLAEILVHRIGDGVRATVAAVMVAARREQHQFFGIPDR